MRIEFKFRRRLFAFAGLLCALLFAGCNKASVDTKLKDPATLRADAMRMLKDLPDGDVPKAQWPKSIKALNPLSVTREADNIKILLAHENGKFSVGYHVFRDPEKRPSMAGVWLEKTGFEGIYVYKTQY